MSAEQERDDALAAQAPATTDRLKAKAEAQVRELGRFVVVGCSAVATDGLVYFLLAGFTAAWIAKTVSFVAGAALAFVLNRGFVFRATGALKAQVLGFCLLYLVSLLLNAGVNELALGMAVAKPIAWFLATATSTVSNFLGMKFIVFRTNKRIEPS